MKKTVMKSMLSACQLLIIVLTICFSGIIAQTSYVWNGSVSTSWTNSNNWTPTGTPGAIDNVTITVGANPVTMDMNRTVANFSINSYTLSLNSFSLTITGNGVFSGGNIISGNILINGTSVNFSGTTFGISPLGTADCNVTASVNGAVANAFVLSGSTFYGTADLTYSGGNLQTGSQGGNFFWGNTTITNSGSAQIFLAYNTTGDNYRGTTTTFNNSGSANLLIGSGVSGSNIFFGTTTFNNNGTGASGTITLCQGGATATFSGVTTFNNIGSGAASKIQVNTVIGTATFMNNILVNCTFGTGITIGSGGGGTTSIGVGKTITVGGTGFTKGTLNLNTITFNGTAAQSLNMLDAGSGGSAILSLSNFTFPGSFASNSPRFAISSCNFNGGADMTVNANAISTISGTNTYSLTANITNNSSAGGIINVSGTNTYNSTTTIINNSGLGSISLENTTVSVGNYNGPVEFAGTAPIKINFAGTGNYTGNVNISNTNALTFGSTANATNNATFTGSGTQTIDAAFPPSFYKLNINKPTTSTSVKLNTDISTLNNSASALNLLSGILDLNGHILTIASNSVVAITVATMPTVAYIQSEKNDFSGKVQWNIGNALAGSNYSIPFGVKIGGTDYAIPYIFNVSTAGGQSGTGNFAVSTYGTDVTQCPNNRALPPSVANLNYSNVENAVYCADRYWKLDVSSYTTTPVYSSSFYYSNAESNTAQNKVNEADLKATKWLSGSSTWDWAGGLGTANIATHYVNVTGMNNTSDILVMHDLNHSMTFPKVTVSSNVTICSSQQNTLSASGANTYSWSPTIFLSASTGSIVTAATIASSQTTTTYSVSGILSTGCTSTATVSITTNPLPSLVTGSGASAICAGSSTTLSVSGADTYLWTPPSSLNSSTSNVLSATPQTTTNYSVTGTYVSTGCNSNTSVNVIVYAIPTASAGIDMVGCVGSDTPLTGSGGTTYVWTPAALLNSNTGASVLFTSATAGTYNYTLTATNGICSSTDNILITVTSLPLISASNDTSICSGSTIALSAVGAVSYVWDPSSSLNSATGGTVSAMPPSTTDYTVTGTDMNGCASSDEVSVTVISSPVLSLSSDVTICINTFATLTATGTNSYFWSPAGSLDTVTGATVIASPVFSTTYLVVGTSNGCSSSGSVNVTVETCSGIQESLASENVIIYPNPSNGNMTINYKGDSDTDHLLVRIINVNGQIVYSDDRQHFTGDYKHSVDLSKEPKGVYLLQLITNKENMSKQLVLR